MPQPWVNADFKQQSTFSRLDPQTKHIEMETRSFAKPYTKKNNILRRYITSLLWEGWWSFHFVHVSKISPYHLLGCLGSVSVGLDLVNPQNTYTDSHRHGFMNLHSELSMQVEVKKKTKSWVTCSLDSIVWWNCCI